jgi:hypothetical protein
MDMDLVFDKEAPAIGEYIGQFAPIACQIGALFFVNGKAVGMDAFGKEETFSRVFKNLLQSYALDAVDRFEKKAHTEAGTKSAKELLASASAAKAESRPSVSLGIDLRLESDKLIGFALGHEGRVVHLCLFPNAGNQNSKDSNRMVRHSTRRQRRGL